MLLILPQLLDRSELAQARAVLATAPWADGRVSAGPQAAQVKNNEQLPADCDAARAVGALVLQALDRSPQFLAAARTTTAGTSTAPFASPRAVSGCAPIFRARCSSPTRITMTAANSPSTRPAPRGQIKLPAGHAVLYSGMHVHEVTPVTRGTRLAAFFLDRKHGEGRPAAARAA